MLLQVFSATFCAQLHAELYMQISGTVVDQETGLGVEKTKVLLLARTGEQNEDLKAVTETNNEGRYLFDAVPPGEYALVVQTPNESNYALDLTPKKIKVERGKNLINVNFQLEIGGSISGIVFGADGVTPMESVPVMALTLFGSKGVKTDNQGKYLIKGLKVNVPITLRAAARGFGSVTRDNIMLLPKSVTTVDLVFGVGPSKIEGTATDINGQPIKTGVFVTFLSETGSVGKALSDQEGKYSITGLNSGTYKAIVMGPGYKILTIDSVLISQGNNALDFSLRPDLAGDPSDPAGEAILVGFSVEASIALVFGLTGGWAEVATDGQAGIYVFYGTCLGYAAGACGGIIEGWYQGTSPPTLQSFCGEFTEFTGCLGPTCITYFTGGGWQGFTTDFCLGPQDIVVSGTVCQKCYKLLFQLAPPPSSDFCPICTCPSFEQRFKHL